MSSPLTRLVLLAAAFSTGLLLAYADVPAEAAWPSVLAAAAPTAEDRRAPARPAPPPAPAPRPRPVDDAPVPPPAPAPPPACTAADPAARGQCFADRHGVRGVDVVVSDRYGHWGAADLARRTVHVSPRVPADRLDDVLLHELAHVRLHDALGLGVDGGRRQLNRVFGGSGWRGADLAADCLARRWGADWTHYTACADERSRAALAAVVPA